MLEFSPLEQAFCDTRQKPSCSQADAHEWNHQNLTALLALIKYEVEIRT